MPHSDAARNMDTDSESEPLRWQQVRTLSEISGISGNMAYQLHDRGFESPDALAHTSPAELTDIQGVGETKAQEFIDRAADFCDQVSDARAHGALDRETVIVEPDTDLLREFHEKYQVAVEEAMLAHGQKLHLIKMDTLEEPPTHRAFDSPSVDKVCSKGRNVGMSMDEYLPVAEAATKWGFDGPTFESEAPDVICSRCWQTVQEQYTQERVGDARTGFDEESAVYRLRWKQKGRASDEWYDIIVTGETTFADLDALVMRFSTLDNFHMRMYGLEGEYRPSQSSLQIIPEGVASPVRTQPDQDITTDVTIGDVVGAHRLREGDRLTLTYDFGTPQKFYYGIIKDVYTPDEYAAEYGTESPPENAFADSGDAWVARQRQSPDSDIESWK